MDTKNIMVAGVGGQGIVLMTGIISQAAARDGYDVKTNDVVGLAQRGGMVWGSVRIGGKIYSPNIPVGEGDILLGMEPLEAYRWSHLMSENSTMVINKKRNYPTPVLLEKEEYPEKDIKKLKEKFNIITLDVEKEAKSVGNIKVANTVMIGVLSKYLHIRTETWKNILKENVPAKAIDENLKAFEIGRNHSNNK